MLASDDLLARGPLALTFFRGPWCPYCSMTLEALNQIHPAIERPRRGYGRGGTAPPEASSSTGWRASAASASCS